MTTAVPQTDLKGLSPPTGEVVLLQLLQLSSRSARGRRTGAGMNAPWLVLLGRYWLKGRAIRGSLQDVLRTSMSSLRTSGIFLWGASLSESLPWPTANNQSESMKSLAVLQSSAGRAVLVGKELSSYPNSYSNLTRSVLRGEKPQIY